MAVAPIGLRDRERGTVGFTTSLGFAKKLDRIRREPRVALAYHAREHGARDGRSTCSSRAAPSRSSSRAERARAGARARPSATSARAAAGVLGPLAARVLHGARSRCGCTLSGSPSGPTCAAPASPSCTGCRRRPLAPDPQPPPKKGTGPRVDMRRAARRLRKTPHVLLGSPGLRRLPGDRRRSSCARSDETGLELSAAPGVIPAGARRAGLLGHAYRPQLVGLTARQHTGWLEAARRQRPVRPAHGRPASWPRPTRRCCCSSTGCRRSRACEGAPRGSADRA